MQEYIVRVYEDRTEWRNKSGKYHRIDGPAFERASGNKEWYIDGVEYTEKEFLAKTQTKELTVAEIEKLLGYSVKIVANKI